MITASKNGFTRNFTNEQWNNMPKDKFGWLAIDASNPQTVDTSIIEKKTSAGVTVEKVVPDEIIKPKIIDLEVSRLGPLSDIPEIKKRGRQPQGGKK